MQVFQDRRGDSLGRQPGEQMLAADLFRTVCASVLSGAVEAGLQAGCGPGGVREHISRRSVGEALPGGLPGDAQLGTDVGPRHPDTASMGDEVVQQPIGSSSMLSTHRHTSLSNAAASPPVARSCTCLTSSSKSVGESTLI
jgi:hypothetical protein